MLLTVAGAINSPRVRNIVGSIIESWSHFLRNATLGWNIWGDWPSDRV
jgi:hypothetical protein